MLLAGDIGGTKTLLGLYDSEAVRPRALLVRTFGTLDYPDLPAMIRAFLADAEAPGAPLECASFGVAGPVLGDSATLTVSGTGMGCRPILLITRRRRSPRRPRRARRRCGS